MSDIENILEGIYMGSVASCFIGIMGILICGLFRWDIAGGFFAVIAFIFLFPSFGLYLYFGIKNETAPNKGTERKE